MLLEYEHVYLFRHAAENILPEEIIRVILEKTCQWEIDDHAQLEKTLIVDFVRAGVGILTQSRKELSHVRNKSRITAAICAAANEEWNSIVSDNNSDSDNSDDDFDNSLDRLYDYDIKIQLCGEFCVAMLVDYLTNHNRQLKIISRAELRQLAGESVWEFEGSNLWLNDMFKFR